MHHTLSAWHLSIFLPGQIALRLADQISILWLMQARKGEPDNTPEEILAMVRQLAAPQHRLLLFLQQSSVEWCSSLWLDVVKSIDPKLQRTMVVVSKFDNRLKVDGSFLTILSYTSQIMINYWLLM